MFWASMKTTTRSAILGTETISPASSYPRGGANDGEDSTVSYGRCGRAVKCLDIQFLVQTLALLLAEGKITEHQFRAAVEALEKA